MTECERIVKDGILPKTYFDEEIQDGFLVEEFRKKMWAVELDLLIEFDRVCKKYNLRYFLFFGTLLGAVRHKGFIPWDDDIDVIMPRQDYEKLICLKDEFKNPYFLQNSKSDKDFLYVHSRLRNSNTTSIQRAFAYRDFNHGCFIDILYYDKVFNDDRGQKLYDDLLELTIKASTFMKLSNQAPNKKDEQRIRNYDGEAPDLLFNRIQNLSKIYNNKQTDYVLTTAAIVYGFKKSCFNVADFDDIVLMEFENYKFPVPKGYKRILTTIYGDYMSFPPEVNRGIWHGSVWYDPDKSYLEVKKSIEYKDWLLKDY